MKVSIICNRCNKTVEGLEHDGGTSGFYRRDEWWGQFMNEGESILCDECMQADPRYIESYSYVE